MKEETVRGSGRSAKTSNSISAESTGNVFSVGIPSSSSHCAEDSLKCPDTPQRC